MSFLPQDPDMRQLLFGGAFFIVMIILVIVLFTVPGSFTPSREGMMSGPYLHPDPRYAYSVYN